MLTFEEYYGDQYESLLEIEQRLQKTIHEYPLQSVSDDLEPILYCKTRIKTPESMMKKLERHGLATDSKSALMHMHDAIGMRIVCSFLDDVYCIADWFQKQNEFELIQIKDYISYPKPNGYRSLHLILAIPTTKGKKQFAEIQLRTIALDFWAALEHQLKYKKEIDHEKTISKELKRCADEIASVDVSMQTLRDLIGQEKWT